MNLPDLNVESFDEFLGLKILKIPDSHRDNPGSGKNITDPLRLRSTRLNGRGPVWIDYRSLSALAPPLRLKVVR
jgi:hypothetical protein